MLSSRGTKSAGLLNIPWRYAAPHTYDKETNPTGTISFGMAEHVCFIYPLFTMLHDTV